jgi:hypothetical protein
MNCSQAGAGKALTWFAFAMLGLSVLMNVSGFIVGSAAVFTAWFGMPEKAAVILYYVLAAGVVFIGMKAVGICEKISVFAMIGVIGILFVAVLLSPLSALPVSRIAVSNVLALYGMVAFSLSSVMSVPQVVKGLNGDVRRIRASIAAGTGINAALIVLITFMTLLGAGTSISGSGALVDLSAHLGGWGQHSGVCFLAACAVHLVLGQHPQSARHRPRADRTPASSVLAYFDAALPAAFPCRALQFCRLHAPCRHHSGPDRACDHRGVRQIAHGGRERHRCPEDSARCLSRSSYCWALSQPPRAPCCILNESRKNSLQSRYFIEMRANECINLSTNAYYA